MHGNTDGRCSTLDKCESIGLNNSPRIFTPGIRNAAVLIEKIIPGIKHFSPVVGALLFVEDPLIKLSALIRNGPGYIATHY